MFVSCVFHSSPDGLSTDRMILVQSQILDPDTVSKYPCVPQKAPKDKAVTRDEQVAPRMVESIEKR